MVGGRNPEGQGGISGAAVWSRLHGLRGLYGPLVANGNHVTVVRAEWSRPFDGGLPEQRSGVHGERLPVLAPSLEI